MVINIPSDIDAFSELHGKALVGRFKDFTTLRTLNSLLRNEACSGLDIQYIGVLVGEGDEAGKVSGSKVSGMSLFGEGERSRVLETEMEDGEISPLGGGSPREWRSQSQGPSIAISVEARVGGFDLNANPAANSFIPESQEQETGIGDTISDFRLDGINLDRPETKQEIQDTIEIGKLLGADLLNHINEVRRLSRMKPVWIPKIVNDGATIAKEVELEDRFENIGVSNRKLTGPWN
ncbi:hypothetical protein L1987_63679 [Smallanthus sonchifolius]|uniref:Uncharacterized protein n=1 Tax=Smallanthus sonchifolius TaxID=185202 RepID=A0ACB9CDX3_9ASTR|nr:hypothetical protein L1987_63679 [Smallanthus sonchifolius]